MALFDFRKKKNETEESAQPLFNFRQTVNAELTPAPDQTIQQLVDELFIDAPAPAAEPLQFLPENVEYANQHGFDPVSLGISRLELPEAQPAQTENPLVQALNNLKSGAKDFIHWEKDLYKEGAAKNADPNTAIRAMDRLGEIAQPDETPSVSDFGRLVARARDEAALAIPGDAAASMPRPSTGNKILDTVANIVGFAESLALPGSAAGQAFKGGGMIAQTPRNMELAAKVENKIAPVAEKVVEKAPDLVKNIVGKSVEGIAERGLRGAAGGAAYGTMRGAAQGENLSDIPKYAAEDAVMFSAFDMGLPFVFNALGGLKNAAGVRIKSWKAGKGLEPAGVDIIKDPTDFAGQGYTEYRPDSGIWQKLDEQGRELDRVYETVLFDGKPIPKYQLWREQKRGAAGQELATETKKEPIITPESEGTSPKVETTEIPAITKAQAGAAIWKRGKYDQPVVITGDMGIGTDGRHYVSIEGSTTGVPLDEIEYPGQAEKPTAGQQVPQTEKPTEAEPPVFTPAAKIPSVADETGQAGVIVPAGETAMPQTGGNFVEEQPWEITRAEFEQETPGSQMKDYPEIVAKLQRPVREPVTITHNTDKNFLEARFYEKPVIGTLKELHRNGFHKTGDTWYARYTPERAEFANRLKDTIAEDISFNATGSRAPELDNLSVDYVREIPKEVNLPNKEFGVDLFNAARELMSPARYARLRKDVLGSFHPSEGKIKLNTLENTATLSHELGHSLDYRLSGNSFPSSILKRFPSYQAGNKPFKQEREMRIELKEVSNLMRPVEGGPANFSAYRINHRELMADYYSLYFLDPELASSKAPTVTKAFESELKNNPVLSKTVEGLVNARAQVKGGLPQVQAIKPVGEPRTPLPEDITEPTEAIKALVKNTDRIYRYQTLEAAKRAEEWGRGLKEEQLEDIGAAVEKIGNLRTGKSYQDILKDMTPKQREVLHRYRFEQERARENVNKFLYETGEKEYIKYIEDYLAHFYTGPAKKKKDFVARWARNSPNAKARKLPTLKEAVDAGLVPLTQNVAELHKKWAAVNWRVAVNRRFVHELKNIHNADGQPVIMKPAKAPADWPVIDHPAIQQTYARKKADGTVELWRGGAAVDPEVYKIVRQVLDKPFTGNVIKAIESFNAYAKKMSLSVSFFHHFALTESAQAALGRIWNPLRSIVLVGGKGETLGSPLRLTYKAGLRLMEDPGFRRDALLHGLTVEAVADVQAGRVERGLEALRARTQNVFGLNFLTRKLQQFNRWWDRSLWGHYYTGLKSYTYYDLVKEALNRMPETATKAEISRTKEKIAELVNDMYGGQEWASKFWLTPEARRVLHITLLAPDWTLTNIQVFGKAFTQAGNPVARKILWRYWTNMLLTFGVGVAGANYALNGKWSWDNEPGHEWDIDVTPVMRALPWHDPEDKQRYYIKPGKQFREVLRYFSNPVEIIGSKLSPAVQTVLEQATGHQAGSGWEMPWESEEMGFYESLPERVKAVADKFIPFAARGNNFAMTFPMSKGMTPWKAMRAYEDMIKAQVDPSLYQRIMSHESYMTLRKELDRACEDNGLDPAEMFKQAQSKARGDYYSSLWEAINKRNYRKADEAAKMLIKMGVTNAELEASGKRYEMTSDELATAKSIFSKGKATTQQAPALKKKVQ